MGVPSRSRRCGAHSASRQRGALPSRHGLETTSVDVSRYSECAERRASVLAPPPRLLARRTLFCLIAHEKCVPAHRKRKKRTSDCLLTQRGTLRTDATGIGSTHQNLRDSRPLGYGHIAEVWAVEPMPVDTCCGGRVIFRASICVSNVRVEGLTYGCCFQGSGVGVEINSKLGTIWYIGYGK
jgi:hypothetical protein